MNTIFTLKRFFQENNSPKIDFFKRKLLLLAIIFGSLSFSSNAQIFISIGSPTDGMEGLTSVSFLVFIEGGVVNSTGTSITGNISYTGTAMEGADFIGAVSFIIPDGASSALVILPVIDDFIPESTESVIAFLTGNPSVGAYGNTTSTANILDDDASNLSISIGSAVNGAEGGGDISFVISLDSGATNGTGSDIYGTINYGGNATSGSDYLSGIGLFNIPNGEQTDTITITVFDDNCIEYSESIIATISAPNIGSISANDSSTAYIADNDSGSTLISIGNPVDGAEGGSDVSFLISIDGGLTNCTGAPITGTVSYTGAAIASLDFINNATFSILDGNASVQLDILVIDDLDIEPTETVIATISLPSLGVISTSNTSTANIIDNDSTSGFDDLYLNDLSVTLYPNPVNSTLNIEAQKQMQNYSIADLKGRVIASGNLNTTETVLTVENLPKGFYFLTVEFSDGTLVSKKVLKQ